MWIKIKNHKTIKEGTVLKPLDINLANIFLPDSKGNSNKSKNTQAELYQNKIHLHSKENHQQNKKGNY